MPYPSAISYTIACYLPLAYVIRQQYTHLLLPILICYYLYSSTIINHTHLLFTYTHLLLLHCILRALSKGEMLSSELNPYLLD
jgi:hypothetical protein